MAIIDKPSDYFNTKLYVGNESTNAITGVGHQPDFVWMKNRASAYYHGLYDSVRGTGNTKSLYSNANETEGQNSGNMNLASFNSDGFTLGATSSTNIINKSSQNHVSWNWKAGGSASSNSNGSITSSVSANTTAGFSIVSWTGNGSNGATIGHGLGTTPAIVITKRLNSTGDWQIGGSLIDTVRGGANSLLLLNTTAAMDSNSEVYQTFSSTTFQVGVNASINTNGGTLISYCFTDVQGYSKFGSYKGNGNANGSFIYTGFKPAFTLIKRTDSATGGSWILFDNKRGTNVINPVDVVMAASNDQSEADWGTAYDCDYLSNGFKWRMDGTGGYNNTSGATYIYMAFAENPFVASNFVPATAR